MHKHTLDNTNLSQEINKSFGINRGFTTEEQRMKLSCGPSNILSTLQYLNKDGNKSLPSIDDLEKECNITDTKGITPNQYEKILTKYIQPLGYKVEKTRNATYKDIIESIENGLPVGSFMLVESKKNPQRTAEERKNTPEEQHGYHFESIVGYSKGEKGDLIWLSNPFGYEEILTKEEFEKRRGLDNNLLKTHTDIKMKYANKLLKLFGIVKPNTLYFIKPTN